MCILSYTNTHSHISPVHEGGHGGSVGMVVLLLLRKLNHSIPPQHPSTSSSQHPSGSRQGRGAGGRGHAGPFAVWAGGGALHVEAATLPSFSHLGSLSLSSPHVPAAVQGRLALSLALTLRLCRCCRGSLQPRLRYTTGRASIFLS